MTKVEFPTSPDVEEIKRVTHQVETMMKSMITGINSACQQLELTSDQESVPLILSAVSGMLVNCYIAAEFITPASFKDSLDRIHQEYLKRYAKQQQSPHEP